MDSTNKAGVLLLEDTCFCKAVAGSLVGKAISRPRWVQTREGCLVRLRGRGPCQGTVSGQTLKTGRLKEHHRASCCAYDCEFPSTLALLLGRLAGGYQPPTLSPAKAEIQSILACRKFVPSILQPHVVEMLWPFNKSTRKPQKGMLAKKAKHLGESALVTRCPRSPRQTESWSR